MHAPDTSQKEKAVAALQHVVLGFGGPADAGGVLRHRAAVVAVGLCERFARDVQRPARFGHGPGAAHAGRDIDLDHTGRAGAAAMADLEGGLVALARSGHRVFERHVGVCGLSQQGQGCAQQRVSWGHGASFQKRALSSAV